MSEVSSYYAELYAEIDRRIRQALKEYRPDLSKASNGALPVNYVPVIGGAKIEDGSITEAKLAFDPATQAELDAEAAARSAADSAEASTRAAADTALAAPSYVTIGSSGTLANERVLAAGVNVQLADAGANSTITIAADHTHGVQASGEWTWKSAATTSDPGTNNVGVNNDSPSLATTLYINKFGPNSVDYSGILSALRANDTIYLQQANDSASWHRYDVTGAPAASGSAFAVPVSTLGGSAQGTEPANNAKVYVVINQGASPSGMLSTEDVQDIVGALVGATSPITATYSDVGNTLTIAHAGHSASDITSGTLPVARGGTGVTAIPAFLVHKNGTAQTGLVANVLTKVTWSTEDYDTNSNFASDKFTPTVAGTYLFMCAIVWQPTTADQVELFTALYKNGSLYKSIRMITSGASRYQGPLLVLPADANGSTDYFEIYARHTDSANRDIYGGITETWWSGVRVAP